MNYYTVYNIHTDEVLTQGNARECAGALGFTSLECFRTMVSRARKGKSSRYAVIVQKDTPLPQEKVSHKQEWEDDVRRRWMEIQMAFGQSE